MKVEKSGLQVGKKGEFQNKEKRNEKVGRKERPHQAPTLRFPHCSRLHCPQGTSAMCLWSTLMWVTTAI